jgi:hypothetical protein
LPKKANWNEIEKLYMNVVQKYICEEWKWWQKNLELGF